MKREFKNFLLIWRSKRSDLKQWLFYNVLLGMLPIWLSWVPLLLGWRFGKMLDPLSNGSALIFAATLTAASIAFFAEESKRDLKDTQRFLWNWLLIILIFSSAAYTAIIALTEFSPTVLSFQINGWLSFSVLLAACLLNLHLAAVRLAYTDNELVAELLKAQSIELTAQAAATKKVDGINL